MPVYNGNSKIKELYYGGTKIKEAYYGSTKVYSSGPLYYCYYWNNYYYYFNEYPYTGAVLPLYIAVDPTFGSKANNSSQLVTGINATIKSVTGNGVVFNTGTGANDIPATRDLTGDLYI